MKLHNLTNNVGATKRSKRIGCGQGSGRGKTSTRGVKGYKSRSGSSIRPGFEGGQLPLYRKLPTRGFNNYRFRTDYALVNVSDLASLEATEIDRDVLVKAGLVRKQAKLIKVLGDGEITSAVTISANKFSKTAVEKIEKAGGKAVVIAKAAKDADQGEEDSK
ncbi:50S ribosomal protein L15 [Rubellicoccus peritrichatus]|uniref:Large ribosomal subunit protein uL15 n=1 Tax=Rubellicoccus peritrichatus TaxID=3080537 RepID=A0AAQ3LD37_9BACT|nr:50S ribosomal protein L15 [Puniceicoccus sp. CR14]WOO43505.1 50S ribosomal protein L15 [Puniceicoccus sp. CR14]